MFRHPALISPCNSISFAATAAAVSFTNRRFLRLKIRSQQQLRLVSGDRPHKSDVISDTLRLLEWDKLCDAVSSFAGTPLGREATKAKLLSVESTFEESKKLLEETSAAVDLINYGARLDFAGVDVVQVKSAMERSSRGFPVDGLEAMAIVSLMQCAHNLQITLETAVKEDTDNYNHFMPLSQLILDAIVSRQLVKSIQQVIDDDGSVKDTASSELRRYRDQVRALDRKLLQLMDKLIREDSQGFSMEVCSVNGRWCLKTMGDEVASFEGLLLTRPTRI